MKNFRYVVFSVLLSLCLGNTPSLAAGIPEGSGLVYGPGFSFNIKAPKGWTLDPSSGANQGLSVVLYPTGGSWSDSPIVAYAQSRPKTPQIQNADDAAKATVEKFHANGSPNYQGKRLKAITTNAGQEAVIYQFSGDKFGNSEAAAYFVEPDRINFLVMNSRDANLFNQSLPAFEDLAKSYKALPLKVQVQGPASK
ncbi:MAG: hypothetical protein U1F57_10155 [bacterium]